MNIPKTNRHTRIKLFILRLYSISALLLCMFSFQTGYASLGYLLVVALVFSAFIKVTVFKLSTDRIEIHKYFLFGLIPSSVSYTQNDPSKTIVFVSEIDRNELTDTAEPIDLLFILFPIKAKFQGVIIKNKKSNGNIRKLSVTLNDKEYNFVLSRFGEEISPSDKLTST